MSEATITLERALALVQVAAIRPLSEYTAMSMALTNDGVAEEDVEAEMNAAVIEDAETAIAYLNDKIARLAVEKEAETGKPVKYIEVDWPAITAPIPLTEGDERYPSSVVQGIWIANSYVAPMLKAETQLRAPA
jgi:hypothetical protein